jgi:D-lactate dehydrogenase
MGRGSKLLAQFARLVEETARRDLPPAGKSLANQRSYQTSAVNQFQKRWLVQPALATRTTPAPTPVFTDAVGAVSVTSEQRESLRPDVYYNVDGHRVDDGRYIAFAKDVAKFIPEARVFTDPLRTFAYGTDASFYRLNPKMVIKVHTEEEMQKLLPLAKQHDVPVTFRAAGTSLSGQAITDSVLLKISHTGKNFRRYQIHVRVLPPLLTGAISSNLLVCGV